MYVRGVNNSFELPYSAIVITRDPDTFDSPLIDPPAIDDAFIELFSSHELVTNAYAVNEFLVYEVDLDPVVPYSYGDISQEIRIDTAIQFSHFSLFSYTDISLSTHFVIGDREILYGRYASNPHEAIISSELAIKNDIGLGDVISLYIFPANPLHLQMEVVGIFLDKTRVVSGEVDLIDFQDAKGSRRLGIDVTSISRNQIITATPSSDDIAVLRGGSWANDFGVMVLYANNAYDINKLEEEIGAVLNDYFVFVSTNILRNSVLQEAERVQRFFSISVIGVFIILFFIVGLLIKYLVVSRSYDICIFRLMGLSRLKTALIILFEFMIVKLFATLVIVVVLFFTGSYMSDLLLELSHSFVNNDPILLGTRFWVSEMMPVYSASDFMNISGNQILLIVFLMLIWVCAIVLTSLTYIKRLKPLQLITR